MIFEEYYADNFERWVKYLTRLIHDPEEAEDRVQNIFASFLPRKKFCEEIILRDEDGFDRYVLRAIILQTAQIRRERDKRVPTVSIDADNIDLISSIRDNQVGMELCYETVELNDFYNEAKKLLEDSRKLTSDCGFETVGELRQYIFIQYCRNGRTLDEIGELVGLSHQNISLHYGRIITILTPLIESFTKLKVNGGGNDLRKGQ